MISVASGTVVLYSDVACPWAHVAVSRLRRFRHGLGLDGAVTIDHRAFPLELFNSRPTPKAILDAEVPVTGAIEPDAGWQTWTAPAHEYPVTSLLALEAVQAAKAQGLDASERLDAALRRAMFAENRCIALFTEVLDVAEEADVEVAALRESLEQGTARHHVFE